MWLTVVYITTFCTESVNMCIFYEVNDILNWLFLIGDHDAAPWEKSWKYTSQRVASMDPPGP